MPNHVEHLLHITGQEAVLDSLVAAVEGHDCVFDFNGIIPMPKCVFRGDLGLEQENVNPGRNWYAWCVRKWGTKWDAYGPPIRERVAPTVLRFRFQTAWSVPWPVLKELAELFPDVTITNKHVCERTEFAGIATYERGALTRKSEIKCDPADPDFRRLFGEVHGDCAILDDIADEMRRDAEQS